MSHHSYYTECTPGYTPKRGSSSSSRVAFVARSFARSLLRVYALDVRARSIDRSIVHSCPVSSSFVGHALDRETRPPAGGTTRDRGGDEGTVPSSRDGDGDDDDAWCGVRTTSSPSTSARVVSRTRRLVVSTLTSTRTRDGRLRVTSQRVEFVRNALRGVWSNRREARRTAGRSTNRSSVHSFIGSFFRVVKIEKHWIG